MEAIIWSKLAFFKTHQLGPDNNFQLGPDNNFQKCYYFVFFALKKVLKYLFYSVFFLKIKKNGKNAKKTITFTFCKTQVDKKTVQAVRQRIEVLLVLVERHLVVPHLIIMYESHHFQTRVHKIPVVHQPHRKEGIGHRLINQVRIGVMAMEALILVVEWDSRMMKPTIGDPFPRMFGHQLEFHTHHRFHRRIMFPKMLLAVYGANESGSAREPT